MQHLAIDLGGTKSQVCIRTADGQIIAERKVETGSLGPYLKGQPQSLIAPAGK
jgi:predicted NBD/HSP70 family sugar kinase